MIPTFHFRRIQRTLIALVLLAGVAGPLVGAPGYTPVRDVNDGIANPFAKEITWFSGTTSGFTETSSYTVPANTRLEITEISCEAYAPGSTQVLLKITVTCGGTTATHFITGFAASTIYTSYQILSMTSHHLYVDPGSTVTVDVVRQSPAGTSIGYYSDVILSGRATPL